LKRENTIARCAEVRKSYATEGAVVEALRGVDAEFSSAAVTAVAGPSGSGKSTLLRLLAAIDLPSAGSISVRELELTVLAPRALRSVRRSIVGYVFQRPSDNFIPYLTLAEHLVLAAGAREPAVPEEELMAELSLSHRIDHYPHELSGGEQQRGAFAQVVLAGARLVVADEPTAELDARSSAAVLGIVSRLAERGVAFVLATHDPTVLRVAHEAIELEDGRIKVWRPGHRTAEELEPQPHAAGRGSQPLLALVRVSKSFQRGPETVPAVDHVSLSLDAGELAGLVGRSGSGKTTLLNVIAGWDAPDTGAVVWADEAPPDPTIPTWREVAVLPQKFGLLEELTVRENVEYPARLAGRLAEMKDWIRELTATLVLDDLADRLPLQTSMGQQQRTALCRALVLRPRLLLADEPTGHQDAGSARTVLRALRLAAAAGTCCLIATHNAEIARHFDTVYRMANGRLTASPRD
jgi:putative ABC transport system ATP-binding protein